MSVSSFPHGTIAAVIQAGLSVDVSDNFVQNFRFGATCTANYKVDNDGSIYKSDNVGTYGAADEVYLSGGGSDEVWVERTVTSGTLSTDTIGGGRVSCATDREIGVTQATTGIKSADVTLDFYDASSGGSLLDTADITVTAENSV